MYFSVAQNTIAVDFQSDNEPQSGSWLRVFGGFVTQREFDGFSQFFRKLNIKL